MTNNDMINHFNIKKAGGFMNPIGQVLMGLAVFQIAGRVIMARDYM
jgi:hypothetical protein